MKSNSRTVKSRRTNKKSGSGFLVVIFIFIISLLVILSTTVFFPINSVSLNYDGNLYTKEQVLKEADIKIGQNIIVLPSKKITNKVTKNLTYIGELKIKKQFPDKVVLTATETSAKYCVKSNKEYLILNENFKVLEASKKPNKKLACINGAKLENGGLGSIAVYKNSEQEEIINAIIKALSESKYKLNYVDFKSSGDVVFYVNKKFMIQLGSTAELDDKLSFMSKMLDEITKKNLNDSGKINLTYFPSKKEGYFTREKIEIKYF